MRSILQKPVITEKMNLLGESLRQYAFVVDGNANKIQIRAAIEEMYGVNVSSVKTMKVPAKATMRMTKSGAYKGRKSGFKKAIVMLEEGETIDFYKEI